MTEDTFERESLSGRPLDAGLDGVPDFDRECRDTGRNRAMGRVSGMWREEVVGRVAFEVFPFLKETGEDKFLDDALEGRSAVSEAAHTPSQSRDEAGPATSPASGSA